MMEKYWYEPIRETIDEGQQTIDEIKEDISRQAGQKYLYEAKRVSVIMHSIRFIPADLTS